MPTTFTTLEMYTILREKIGDQEAQLLTHYIEQQVETKLTSYRLSTLENLYQRKMKAEADEKRWEIYVYIIYAIVMMLLIGLHFKN